MINEVKEMKRKNSEEEGVDEENNRVNDWSGNGKETEIVSDCNVRANHTTIHYVIPLEDDSGKEKRIEEREREREELSQSNSDEAVRSESETTAETEKPITSAGRLKFTLQRTSIFDCGCCHTAAKKKFHSKAPESDDNKRKLPYRKDPGRQTGQTERW
ncbi:hypothetical protein RUM43_008743 [Polyplax serrata]|uniref:Uncharacterized protein n=1 Tax=Polyplax serrata TaxID=468196 RepID=A0AAN8S868_POLSC